MVYIYGDHNMQKIFRWNTSPGEYASSNMVYIDAYQSINLQEYINNKTLNVMNETFKRIFHMIVELEIHCTTWGLFQRPDSTTREQEMHFS